MILIIIAILLILSAMSDWSAAEDWERSERDADARHRQLMDALERKSKRDGLTRARRTRTIKEPSGRVLVEEIELEGDFDDDDDYFEDEAIDLDEAIRQAEDNL